jgi:replicative DNA helicase
MIRSIAHADHGIEARYLAAIFFRPNAIEECAVTIGDLASPAHQTILGCMMTLRARSEDITPLAVHIELERVGKKGLQERCAELSTILELDPTACARRLRELAEQRRLAASAHQALEALASGDTGLARSTLASVASEAGADDDPILTFRQMLTCAVESLATADASSRYHRLGLPALDDVFRAGPGDLVVIGAATGTGKSTMVTTIAMSLARRKVPVGIISIEDGAEDFGSKGLTAISGVPAEALWTGAVDAEQLDAMHRGIDVEGDLPVRFAKIRSRSIEGVVSRMASMARVHGCKVIFVDYLQAIRHRDVGSNTREKVNDSLAALMAAAAQLDVALVLCSQLRRAGEGSQFHEPHMGDLKESGDIENSAQCIVLLWRETDNLGDPRSGITYGKIAKVKRASAGGRFWLQRNRFGLLEERGGPAPAKASATGWKVYP